MIQCEYRCLLSPYLDRQLAEDVADDLKNHLPHCPLCREELKELTALRQICMGLQEQDIPDGLHEGIMSRIRSEERPKSRMNWIRYAVIPLAAVLLIFFISRGIPDALRGNSGAGMSEDIRAESSIMAASEEGSADRIRNDKAEEKMSVADSPEEPEAYGEPERDAGAADADKSIADKADTDKSEADKLQDSGSGETDTKESNMTVQSQMMMPEGSGDKDQTAGTGTFTGGDADAADAGSPEKPGILRYGIPAAVLLALGAILFKIWKPRR